MKTKTIIICAVFAAILSIFSVMTIPIGPVPISMSVFGVLLTAIILGPKKGAISVIVYILLGAVGLPVFSGFKGGFQVLAGPTGGYIWSYIFMALFVGFIASKPHKNKLLTICILFVSSIAGIIICYGAGTVQFMFVQQTDVMKALTLCVIPFIPFDIIKAIAASFIGYSVQTALKKSGVLI